MKDCRAKFEEWASNNGEYPQAVERSVDGESYMLMQTWSAWQVWKAAWEKCQETLK